MLYPFRVLVLRMLGAYATGRVVCFLQVSISPLLCIIPRFPRSATGSLFHPAPRTEEGEICESPPSLRHPSLMLRTRLFPCPELSRRATRKAYPSEPRFPAEKHRTGATSLKKREEQAAERPCPDATASHLSTRRPRPQADGVWLWTQ